MKVREEVAFLELVLVPFVFSSLTEKKMPLPIFEKDKILKNVLKININI